MMYECMPPAKDVPVGLKGIEVDMQAPCKHVAYWTRMQNWGAAGVEGEHGRIPGGASSYCLGDCQWGDC